MEEGNKECQMLDSRAKLAVFSHLNDTKISRKYQDMKLVIGLSLHTYYKQVTLLYVFHHLKLCRVNSADKRYLG